MRTGYTNGRSYIFPSSKDVRNVTVGCMATSYSGKDARVTRVYARGVSNRGDNFVCYYTEHGSCGGEISNTLVSDRIMRYAGIGETSADLDRAEANLRAQANKDEVE